MNRSLTKQEIAIDKGLVKLLSEPNDEAVDAAGESRGAACDTLADSLRDPQGTDVLVLLRRLLHDERFHDVIDAVRYAQRPTSPRGRLECPKCGCSELDPEALHHIFLVELIARRANVERVARHKRTTTAFVVETDDELDEPEDQYFFCTKCANTFGTGEIQIEH